MIGEALGLAALCGDDVDIGIAVIGGGEGDPFAVGRKFGVELVAGAGGEAAGGAPFARGGPEIARVGKDDLVFGNVGVAEKARGSGRNLVCGRGLAVRRRVEPQQHGEKDCECEEQTDVFSSHCAFSDVTGFSIWRATQGKCIQRSAIIILDEEFRRKFTRALEASSGFLL